MTTEVFKVVLPTLKKSLLFVLGILSSLAGFIKKFSSLKLIVQTHGVLNAVSWGLLLPMGAIFARYLKTFKSADPAWFYLHVACQLIGYAVGVSGWATGIHLGNLSKGITYSVHRNIGITVFALGTLQVHAPFSSHDAHFPTEIRILY